MAKTAKTDAPERQDIDLLAKMTDEDIGILGRELGQEFERYAEDSASRLQSVQVWRDQFEGVLPAKKVDWSCNVNIPTSEYMLNSTVEALAPIIFGSDPVFDVAADTPEWEEQAKDVEQNLQYHATRMNMLGKGSIAIREALITGECWFKSTVRRTGKSVDIKTLVQEGVVDASQLDSKPDFEYVIYEDFMLLPFHAPNFDLAKGAFSRVILRWADLVKGKKEGRYYKSTVDFVENQWSTISTPTQIEATQGVDVSPPIDIWRAEFECWEGIYRWPVPGTDEEKEWLVLAYYNQESGGDAYVLRMAPYEELYGAGWFFTPLLVDPEPLSMHGRSMCESLRGLANWTNAMFSQCSDAITISILPPVVVPPGTNTARRRLKWGPMNQWEISNPGGQEVQIMTPGLGAAQMVTAGFEQMDQVRQLQERLTGRTDVNMGKPSQEKRTAFEIGAVIEQGNTKVNYQVARLQTGVEENGGLAGFAEKIVDILSRYSPPVPIRYKGKRGAFSVIDPSAYKGRYIFTPHGNNANQAPAVKLQRAMAIKGQVLGDPATGQAPSPFATITPLDTPDTLLQKVQRMYRATENYLQAIGEPDVEGVIGTEPESLQDAIPVASLVAPQALQAIIEANPEAFGIQPQPTMGPAMAGIDPTGGMGGGMPGMGGDQPDMSQLAPPDMGAGQPPMGAPAAPPTPASLPQGV